jgi:hypothetical protein
MLPSKTPCNLDSILHGLSSRRAKEQGIQLARQTRHQQIHQFQHLFMITNVHLSMDDPVQLSLGGRYDARMAVARVEYANSGREIE